MKALYDRIMKPKASYNAINTQGETAASTFEDDDGSYDDDNSYNSDIEDGTNSVAASPHWSVPFQSPTTAGFTPFVAFCFTINYILGTGFLTIPWAFVQSGLILSSILMILSAIASDIAKDYLLETMARAEVMLDDQMHWIHGHEHNDDEDDDNRFNRKKLTPRTKTTKKFKGRPLLPPTSKMERERQKQQLLEKKHKENEQEMTSYQQEQNGGVGGKNQKTTNPKRMPRSASSPNVNEKKSYDGHVHFTSDNEPQKQPQTPPTITLGPKAPPKYMIEQRKFEVNALCRVFLGKVGLQVYTLVISLYLCGALWAYTSVFSSAMATAVPILPDDGLSINYLCYAIIFGCIVVPLSCLELDEQVPLQVFLTGCRFLMFFLMIGTSFICSEDDFGPSYKQEHSYEPANNFDISGIAKTLPILVFANIFHHSIPGLAHPVGDKRKVGNVFTATNMFTVAAYITLGITLGSAFGKSIEQSSNLNWNHFHAGTAIMDEYGNIIDRAWWTKLISNYILLFPAVDVVSAFPLNAITLGNNLFGAAYGRRIHEVEHNRYLRTGFRLLASIPPIIFGMLVRELGVITDYTGTSGFLIGLCFPAILYQTSRQMAKEKHFDLNTFYTNYGSNVCMSKFIFWFGMFMMIFVFTSLTFF